MNKAPPKTRGSRWMAGLVLGVTAVALGGCASSRAATTAPRAAWMDANEELRIARQVTTASAEPVATRSPATTSDEARLTAQADPAP